MKRQRQQTTNDRGAKMKIVKPTIEREGRKESDHDEAQQGATKNIRGDGGY